MTDNEIRTFIETMEAVGDLWDSDEVRLVYGGKSLEEALTQRQTQVRKHLGNLAQMALC